MRAKSRWVKGCHRLVQGAKRLLSDRRANVLMMVGLAAPVVFGTAGFAVDYGYASYLKRSLDQASDAASLAATSQSAAASGGGYSNVDWLRHFGLNTFTGDTATLNIAITPTLTVIPNGTGGVVATTSYTYDVPTYFSSMIGIPTITIAGSATATANPLIYIDYYILLDISQSMGIGSTQSDMQAMFDRSLKYNNDGCVFGCHVTKSKSGGGNEPYSNESLAHTMSPTITLRIDAAITAIQNIIADAKTASGTNKNVRIGLYTMSDDPVSGTQLNEISKPSSDYSGLSTLAAKITLGGNTPNGLGDTNYSPQFSQMAAKIPLSGLGFSSSSPKNYVFIVSDGAGDYNTNGGCYFGHCTAAISPSDCEKLKTNATVGTIYTTYLPIYNNNDSTKGYQGDYSSTVAKFQSQIAPNMQSCASSMSLSYQASDGAGINNAMASLFNSTLKTARLIQ